MSEQKKEIRARGEKGEKKEGWNTDFVRVCLVLLLVCNKRATGGQDCWCDFCKKRNFTSVLPGFGLEK